MSIRWNHRRTRTAVATVLAAAALAAAPYLVRECDVCQAASDIFLSGYVPGVCTIVVTENAQASNLPITAAGAQRVLVGTVLQNCNGRRTYVLMATSRNCPASPVGGKLLNDAADRLPYSVEFNNPTTGMSYPVVTGLLQSACTDQVGRHVQFSRIRDETSSVYVNFTGAPDLAAGTYEDIVTISIYAM